MKRPPHGNRIALTPPRGARPAQLVTPPLPAELRFIELLITAGGGGGGAPTAAPAAAPGHPLLSAAARALSQPSAGELKAAVYFCHKARPDQPSSTALRPHPPFEPFQQRWRRAGRSPTGPLQAALARLPGGVRRLPLNCSSEERSPLRCAPQCRTPHVHTTPSDSPRLWALGRCAKDAPPVLLPTCP